MDSNLCDKTENVVLIRYHTTVDQVEFIVVSH